jgi:hypothetical protein
LGGNAQIIIIDCDEETALRYMGRQDSAIKGFRCQVSGVRWKAETSRYILLSLASA